jgi:glucosyl-3-phosphoglycerate phosphatase
MDRLILVRHGETEWNARKVLQGQADIALSERGREQAVLLKPLLAKWLPERAVCSDLLRARQTAQLLGWDRAAADARWREADLGDWTARPTQDLLASDAAHYQRWRDGVEAPPGGETMDQFRARVAAAIQSLSSLQGNVLVVTHGGVIRAVLAVLLGLTADRIVPVEPGSLTVLKMTPTPRLLAYNHTALEVETQTAD